MACVRLFDVAVKGAEPARQILHRQAINECERRQWVEAAGELVEFELHMKSVCNSLRRLTHRVARSSLDATRAAVDKADFTSKLQDYLRPACQALLGTKSIALAPRNQDASSLQRRDPHAHFVLVLQEE